MYASFALMRVLNFLKSFPFPRFSDTVTKRIFWHHFYFIFSELKMLLITFRILGFKVICPLVRKIDL